MLDKIIKFFTSMKLTVVCLVYAMVLVFIGTIAQVDEGLYVAQARYFKSWFVFRPMGWPIPVIPGGYLVGGLLLINLVMSYVARYRFSRKTMGLAAIHLGLVLLLLGQLATDFWSKESSMRLIEGESKNYSESFSANELVLVKSSDPASDQVIAIPESTLARKKEIQLPTTDLTLRVKQYWPNADLLEQTTQGAVPSGASQGMGTQWFVLGKPRAAKMDERDLPTALVELVSPKGSLGSWLVSARLGGQFQPVNYEGKTYHLTLRFARHYYPFSISLLKFRHDKYKGTEIPKNFSSEIRLANAKTGEDRPVLIRMNEPLRYHSTTFYQGSYDPNDPRVSILQVVRNPSWITPYISCILVGLGLTIQFLAHLLGFLKNRKSAPTPAHGTQPVSA